MRLSLIEIRELDQSILQELDDVSLGQVSQVNKWLYNLCQDDLFWKQRLELKYGLGLPKNPKESYKESYIRLIQLKINPDQPYFSAKHGYLDELILLKRKGIPFDNSLSLAAVETSQIEVLKWLHQEKIPFHVETIGRAISWPQ